MFKLHKTLSFKLICLSLFSTHAIAQKIGDPYPKDKDLIKEGIELFDAEEYQKSVDKYIQVNPNDSFYSDALHELSLAYIELKKPELSAEAALKGLQLQNDNRREFLLLYANALDEAGKSDSAMATYELGLKEFPYYNRYSYEKGVLLLKTKKWDLALTTLIESAKNNPYHPLTHYRIGLLAAEAKQPAIALMALQTYLILTGGGSNTSYTVGIMENIANNEYVSGNNVPQNLFHSEDFVEINDIILSKAALSKSYKSKVKSLDYWIIKQIQVTLEKLPNNYTSDNWLLNFYSGFYKGVWNANVLEGMIVSSFAGLDNKETNKAFSANQDKITAFANYANGYLTKVRNDRKVLLEGKLTQTQLWFDGLDLYAMGSQDENKNRTGYWQYYNNGKLSSEGRFAESKKVGKWTYYYFNGQIKSIEIYDNQNKLNGPYTSFHDNSAPQETSTFVNDELNGETILYNANGTISNKLQYTNGNRNGIRYNYDDYGQLLNKGEQKDNTYIGNYKSYHNNGALDFECKVLDGDINGPVEYFHRNGVLRTKGTFITGKRTGNWKWYNESGKLESEGDYANDNQVGTWKWYNENGTIKEESIFDNGKLKGLSKLYDDAGKIRTESIYKNGKVDSYKNFDENGTITSQQKTEGGKLLFVKYNQYRQKMAEGQLVNGLEQGVWKYYYPNGTMKYEMTYDKGEQSGTISYFFKNGKPYYEMNYNKNSREGFYKSFYLNGKVNSTGYYLNDAQHGEWTFYNADGTLNESNFYQEGTLVGLTNIYLPQNKLSRQSIYKDGFFNNYIQYDTAGKAYNTTGLKFGTGVLKLVEPNNRVTYECSYIGGKKHGKSISYYVPGKIEATDSFYMGRKEGVYKAFHYNGKVQTLGYYVNNEKDSIWSYYNESGKMYRMIAYKNGESNGLDKTFDDFGNLEIEKYYKDDVRHGDYIYYSTDGTVIYKALYVNGVLTAYTSPDKDGKLKPMTAVKDETAQITTYHPNGNKALSFKIEKGYLQGLYEVYFPNGKLKETIAFVDGDNEGPNKTYYPNGNLKKHKEFLNDELTGVLTEYYENGTIASQVPYVNDYKHGVAKFFDATGKTTQTINYVYGIIQK